MTEPPSPQDVARTRARLYDLLATIFDGEVDALERAIHDGTFEGAEAFLEDDFDLVGLDRDDLDAADLGIGYDNLFVVPGPHYVPPFASAHDAEPTQDFESDSTYHDEGTAGELFGAPAVSVSAHYDRVDFRPTRGDGIPDHVAAEFEFVAALASREAALLECQPRNVDVRPEDTPADVDPVGALRRAQRSFLAEELTWLDEFAAAVDREDGAEGVFAAVARFASAFVEWDRRTLGATIGETAEAETTPA